MNCLNADKLYEDRLQLPTVKVVQQKFTKRYDEYF